LPRRAAKDPTIFSMLFEDSAALLGLAAALVGFVLADRLDLLVLAGAASLAMPGFSPPPPGLPPLRSRGC